MPLSNYHPVVTQILNLLQEKNIWHETFEHAPVRTSEEAAKTRPEYTLSQGAKALIVKIKPFNNNIVSSNNNVIPAKAGIQTFIMLVLPGNKKFDGKKVKKLLRVKDISFASVEEVLKVTGGIQVGGVPPFGNLFNIPVYLDPSLLEHEKIIFNAGDRSFSIAMKSEDYKSIVNPIITSII